MNLTLEQKQAIEYIDGPLLILAGPGAGKTEVIARKVVFLLDNGYAKEDILVTTFSNKATEELIERIAKYANQNVQDIQISTIHSFCNQLIEDYIEYSHYQVGFRVLDDIKQYYFILSNMSNL